MTYITDAINSCSLTILSFFLSLEVEKKCSLIVLCPEYFIALPLTSEMLSLEKPYKNVL